MVDDLLDFTADEKVLGKPVANDLREGKLTLPVIFLLRRGGPRGARRWSGACSPTAASTACRREELVRLAREHGALDEARALAERYADSARQDLRRVRAARPTARRWRSCPTSSWPGTTRPSPFGRALAPWPSRARPSEPPAFTRAYARSFATPGDARRPQDRRGSPLEGAAIPGHCHLSDLDARASRPIAAPARRDPPARAALLRPGPARDRRRGVRPALARAARPGGGSTRSWSRPTAPPSAWASSPARASRRSSTACPCSASTTPTARTSCASSRSASSGRSASATLDYVAELKIDGLSMALHYEDGRLARGVTRGDGVRGDDVTPNVRAIRAVPLALAGEDVPDELEVRGEVFLPRSRFEAINREREERGEEPFANPRNAAAGTMKTPRPARGGRARPRHLPLLGRPREGRAAARASGRRWTQLRGWGLARTRRSRLLPRPGRGAGLHRASGRRSATRWSTTSTAWW